MDYKDKFNIEKNSNLTLSFWTGQERYWLLITIFILNFYILSILDFILSIDIIIKTDFGIVSKILIIILFTIFIGWTYDKFKFPMKIEFLSEKNLLRISGFLHFKLKDYPLTSINRIVIKIYQAQNSNYLSLMVYSRENLTDKLVSKIGTIILEENEIQKIQESIENYLAKNQYLIPIVTEFVS